MKISAVVLALSAAVAYGQSISDLPGCALNCFLGPLQSDGCKSLTDFKCHCSNPSLLPKVQPCVAQKCPASLVQEVQDKAVALCKQYGVDLTIPGDGSASSTSASASKSTSEMTSAYTTSKAVSTSTSVYVSSSVTTRTYPTGNGTSPTLNPPPPTGAAGKASFGGAAVAAAGFAALIL